MPEIHGPEPADDAGAEVDARSPVDPRVDAGGAEVDASTEPAACTPGFAREARQCVDVVAALHGRRIEAPCGEHVAAPHCRTNLGPKWTGVAGGTGGTHYDVVLRVRGVVELAIYANGEKDDFFYVGGEPQVKDLNVFHMRVDGEELSTSYFFNAGETTFDHLSRLDYEVTVVIEAGDHLLVEPRDDDIAMVRNMDERGDPIVVRDVPPAPEPFDGQFIQLDVVSVVPR